MFPLGSDSAAGVGRGLPGGQEFMKVRSLGRDLAKLPVGGKRSLAPSGDQASHSIRPPTEAILCGSAPLLFSS